MMEFLEFAFRDFWTFIGIIILIYSIGAAGFMITSGLRGFVCIYNSTNEEDKSNGKSENNLS